MVAFIDLHRQDHAVEPICAQLPIAPSTCYEHKRREEDPSRCAARTRRDRELLAHIRQVHREHHGVHGACKVWRQLRTEGCTAPRCAVEWLTRADALEQARWARGKPEGLVHPSGRESRYLSIRYSEWLKEAGVDASCGTVGDSYDGAMAESAIGLFKAEVIHRSCSMETPSFTAGRKWGAAELPHC